MGFILINLMVLISLSLRVFFDSRGKSAFLEIFVNFFLLLSNHSLYFVLLPDVNPLEKGGVTSGQISLALLY
jgi:hypothetical protein